MYPRRREARDCRQMEVVQEGPHTLSGNIPASNCSWAVSGKCKMQLAGLSEAILCTVEHLCSRYCLGTCHLCYWKSIPSCSEHTYLAGVTCRLPFLLNTQVQQVPEA